MIGAVAYGLLHSGAETADSTAAQWLPAQPQPLENQLGLVGRIEAATRQTLSAPFEGVVQQVAVTEGQRVERGQHLLTLDTRQLDIQLRQARAELLKARRTVQEMRDWAHGVDVARARRAVTNAEFTVNNTESELADSRRLFERGIVARMEVESLEQQFRLQRLELTASQAELRAAQARGPGDNRQIADMELANAQACYDSLDALLAQRELRAPFAGIVLRPQKSDGPGAAVAVHQGQPVSQGAPLLELASLERINATARIEEVDLHQLSEGMDVQVTGDGFDGLTLRGRVLSIGAQAIVADVYGDGSAYEVIVAIDPLAPEQQQSVRLGMSARLAVVTYRAESGLAVPAEALQQDQNGSTYVVHRKALNQPSRKVTVTPGRAVPQGVKVSGLEPGFVELPKTGR
ncbi:RND transporter [Stutzerimonas kirkiae]|nr:RND transporter [Stutzerimonas kirkiae]